MLTALDSEMSCGRGGCVQVVRAERLVSPGRRFADCAPDNTATLLQTRRLAAATAAEATATAVALVDVAQRSVVGLITGHVLITLRVIGNVTPPMFCLYVVVTVYRRVDVSLACVVNT